MGRYVNPFEENHLVCSTNDPGMPRPLPAGVTIPQSNNTSDIVMFALQYFGLNTSALTSLLPANSNGSPFDLSQVLGLSFGGKTIQQWLGSYDNLQSLIGQFNSDPETGADSINLDQIFQDIQTQVLGTFQTELWQTIAVQVLKSLTPAAGFLQMFSMLQNLVSKGGQIFKQFQDLTSKFAAVLNAAGAKSRTAVASAVSQGLNALTTTLLTLLGAFGLDTVKTKIQGILQSLKMKIQCALQKLMAWLLGKCGQCAAAKAGCGTGSNTGTGKSPLGQCFTRRVAKRKGDGLGRGPMGASELGEKVQTFQPGEPGYGQSGKLSEIEANPWAYRAVWFMLEEDGRWVKFGMLKSVLWMAVSGVHKVGDRVRFDLEEMGVVGEAQVMSIGPCPAIEPGPGALVVSVFEHSEGEIWELTVEGESQPIESTENHPFWSGDRITWVPLRELRVGERLSGVNGFVPVLKVKKTDRRETVYNIEVEGDHCYRIGEQGVLVHNASVNPVQVMATSSSSSVGLRYAIATWRYRRRDSNFAMKGPRWGYNYGYLTFTNQRGVGGPNFLLGAGPQPVPFSQLLGTPTPAPQRGYNPDTTHSEQQLFTRFEGLQWGMLCPVSDVIVVEFFSEREPCGACQGVLGMLLMPYNQPLPNGPGGPSVIPIWFLVPDGPNSDDDLRQWYLGNDGILR